jgi:hypothetical protein
MRKEAEPHLIGFHPCDFSPTRQGISFNMCKRLLENLFVAIITMM